MTNAPTPDATGNPIPSTTWWPEIEEFSWQKSGQQSNTEPAASRIEVSTENNDSYPYEQGCRGVHYPDA